jgi:hypothetical protein
MAITLPGTPVPGIVPMACTVTDYIQIAAGMAIAAARCGSNDPRRYAANR